MTAAAAAPVHEALLDDATVAQLFFDIGHAADLIGITLKAAGARRADPVAAAAPSLDDAHRAFATGAVGAVQLRYRFGDEEWWDTLVRTSTGVRLIRISHTRALAAASGG